MDTFLETRPTIESRPSIVANDRFRPEPTGRDYPGTYLPSTGPARLSSQDIAAGVLMAIIMIGPLAAAAIGRMT